MFQGFQFENSEFLYGLFIIPFLILVFVLVFISKKRAIRQFGRIEIIKNLMPNRSTARPVLKFSINILAIIFIILSLAKPQFGSKLKEVKSSGAEIIVALDISNSMLTQDNLEDESRLHKAKRIINKVINNYKGDKIGLIVFAGEAYMQVPLTLDHKGIELILESVSPSYITAQGTAIGEAINLAKSSFPTSEKSNKTIIIISDGENHEGNAENIAQSVAGQGIMVHTVGIGSAEGNAVPDPKNPNAKLRDRNGQVVISKMNPEMLENIAIAGKGVFVDATKNINSLKKIYEQINKAETGEIVTYEEYDDKYQYFVAIALILLIINSFILERKNKWLSKIKLFD